MNLPAKLAKSRHGIFYYRHQYQENGRRREQRISLGTRHPATAKKMAVRISAIIDTEQNPQVLKSMAFDPNDPSTYGELDLANIKKLDINLPSGIQLKVHNMNDVRLAQEFVRNQPAPFKHQLKQAPAEAATAVPENSGYISLIDVVELYKTRNAPRLAPKSLADYVSCQNRFAEWVAKDTKYKTWPICWIDRKAVARYIDHLIEQGIGLTTIKQKHLAALGGLFELAKANGDYEGELPTRGHKIISKTDINKKASKTAWKQFSTDELKKVFEPTHYLTHRKKPDDFWLPLLAIFTGARLNELCQLTHDDILEEHGVWLVNINDENDKRVKTVASIRKVPIHSQLIGLGFLDYLEDTKPFGGRLFPHLTRNKFGGYSDTPSERWGLYLDKIGITSSQKVFHSLRKTANDRLKKAGVHVEARCQLIGHEFDNINTEVYSEEFTIQQMRDSIEKLSYQEINFDQLKVAKGHFVPFLTRAHKSAQSKANHLKARAEREARSKNK